MKFIMSQIMFLLSSKETSKNIVALFKFLGFLAFLIFAYSIIFHLIMNYEERSYSLLTGLYWTLTVMSTLGFGDITFYSDLGRMFSVIVLLTGIIFLLVMLPFTFIQFFYAPWLNAQSRLKIPKKLENVEKHIIIVGSNASALDLYTELERYDYKPYILASEMSKALELYNLDYRVAIGDYDDEHTYTNLLVDKASMVVALEDDIKNTSITFTVREASARVPIISSVEQDASLDILSLAGANWTLQFTKMLGQALARRTIVSIDSGIIGEFGELVVAESPIMRTALVGKTLKELHLRANLGINVAGLWVRGKFQMPNPDEPLPESAVLVIAGTKEQKKAYDNYINRTITTNAHVIILGGGKVGQAAAEYFYAHNIDFRIVDKRPLNTRFHTKLVIGNAADIEVLEQAGLDSAHTVLVTTHDDDMNIYLTIYCRRLKPELQVITRSTLERNISVLHTAGADLVMSYASQVSNSIINLLSPGKVLMLSEGLNIFKIAAPESLNNKTLADSQIRQETNCNIIAIIENDIANSSLQPDTILKTGQELVIIGDSKAEEMFREKFL